MPEIYKRNVMVPMKFMCRPMTREDRKEDLVDDAILKQFGIRRDEFDGAEFVEFGL